MARTGRPRKEIDKDQFEKLCAMQCTILEVCAWFDVEDDTLNAWCKRTYNKTFSEVFKQKREKGKISLRRRGFEMAMENPSVHIFYAKNFLGMTDKVETQVSVISDETRASVNELISELNEGASLTNPNEDTE